MAVPSPPHAASPLRRRHVSGQELSLRVWNCRRLIPEASQARSFSRGSGYEFAATPAGRNATRQWWLADETEAVITEAVRDFDKILQKPSINRLHTFCHYLYVAVRLREGRACAVCSRSHR
jgi:hypothetical protein